MKRLLVVAALLLAPARSVAQDARDFGLICMPGAFQACAGISLGLIYDPTTDWTQISLSMNNPQGTPGFPDLGQKYGIRGLTIVGLAAERNPNVHAPDEALGCYCPGLLVGNSSGPLLWDLTMNFDAGSIFTLSINGNQLIWGCDGPPTEYPWVQNGSSTVLDSRTCGSDAQIIHQQRIPGHWDLTDGTQVGFYGLAEDGSTNVGCPAGSGAVYPRNTDPCVAFAQLVSVTPEPVSLVLLGTGLMGIGGVGALRKRRKNSRL